MTSYRKNLPQLEGGLFLTDGGIETTLIFLEGQELPDFSAFTLLTTPEGEAVLRKYFRTYVELAKRFGTGVILETATWRASRDWGVKLKFNTTALAAANRKAVALLEELRQDLEAYETPIVISGCIGPRGDGYKSDRTMSVDEAREYHREQVETLADTSADLITAMTMNYVEEATGVVQAARDAGMPVVISFTVETDGKLPTGQTLGDAIRQVDAATAGYAKYYMINCAHPSHFSSTLVDPACADRICGLRANASHMSHAELDQAEGLDDGDPWELGKAYASLRKNELPNLNVVGGCCGTDHRHVEQMALHCLPLFRVTSALGD
ncbi:MAG TPA: homocysteine S-methyltransferase family protein [Acidobacteriota bacterium]|nr:homocysteine S-methyltransferase family protein [Acidobacteriota bacterium]